MCYEMRKHIFSRCSYRTVISDSSERENNDIIVNDRYYKIVKADSRDWVR